jgi:hypothetical protein
MIYDVPAYALWALVILSSTAVVVFAAAPLLPRRARR